MTVLAERPAATQAVIDRYDAVRGLVDTVMARGASTRGPTAAPLLECEARWLDARAFDRWLTLYAEDACVWAPAHPDDHPGRDQALAFDDKRRLQERAWHMSDPQAWAIAGPEPVTLRQIGLVAAWAEGDCLLATSGLTITHTRRGPAHVLRGRQIVEIDASGLIRTKILIFPDLSVGAPHLGWLM